MHLSQFFGNESSAKKVRKFGCKAHLLGTYPTFLAINLSNFLSWYVQDDIVYPLHNNWRGSHPGTFSPQSISI